MPVESSQLPGRSPSRHHGGGAGEGDGGSDGGVDGGADGGAAGGSGGPGGPSWHTPARAKESPELSPKPSATSSSPSRASQTQRGALSHRDLPSTAAQTVEHVLSSLSQSQSSYSSLQNLLSSMDSHVIISCSSARIGRSGRGACSLQASPFQAQRSGFPRHCVRGRPLQGTRPLGKRANTIATTMARRGLLRLIGALALFVGGPAPRRGELLVEGGVVEIL